MAEQDGFDPNLWKPRSVAETQAIYDDWAERYDADVIGAGYLTPVRVADALARAFPKFDATILDYGCGTGLSGQALQQAGYANLHGTDINPRMLAEAEAKGVYDKLWASEPGAPQAVTPGDYAAITATGVISLGAAPPDMLATLLDCLAPGGFLALSYNDATLADETYQEALAAATHGPATLISEAYGPHLKAKEMGSSVYVLQRR
ncbi:MAG: methyltransferase domain-containing protein [Pseudomonadota bacterium]